MSQEAKCTRTYLHTLDCMQSVDDKPCTTSYTECKCIENIQLRQEVRLDQGGHQSLIVLIKGSIHLRSANIKLLNASTAAVKSISSALCSASSRTSTGHGSGCACSCMTPLELASRPMIYVGGYYLGYCY